MGKRTNTILQSAFFTLAKVMPQEEAIQYMKDAATKSYAKKGQDIVDMNHKAIDAGATVSAKGRMVACGHTNAHWLHWIHVSGVHSGTDTAPWRRSCRRRRPSST